MIKDCRSLSAKWEILSAYLGLTQSTIDTIKHDYSGNTLGCWNKALSEWIKQSYNADRYGKPSWRTLLRAVVTVDKLLFDKLRRKHPGKWINIIYIISIVEGNCGTN